MNGLKAVRLCEIFEVWESWNGWYWFVTEYHDETFAFGLMQDWETAWGEFDLKELRRLARRSKVWKVQKRNWAFCPGVINDAVSCSWLKVGGERQDKKAMPELPAMKGTVAQTQRADKSVAGLRSSKFERGWSETWHSKTRTSRRR